MAPEPTPSTIDIINAASTVVVAVFALVQLIYIEAQRRYRLRAAFGSAWVQYWRVESTLMWWKQEDLLKMAVAGILDPTEAAPSNWSDLGQLLGQLGMQSARFGGTGLASAMLAAKRVALLNASAAEFRERIRDVVGEEARAAHRKEWEKGARITEAKIIELLEKSTSEIGDALKSAPDWLQREEIRLDGLESQMAAQLRQHFPEPKRSFFGRIASKSAVALRWLADRLA